MDVCLLYLCAMLSCVGRGLCDGMITRPEDSCSVSNCMCDHGNPERGPTFQLGTYRKVNEWISMLQAGWYSQNGVTYYQRLWPYDLIILPARWCVNEFSSCIFCPSVTIRQIKSRRIRWAGHVAHMGEECTRFYWESLKERDYSEDQGVDGRIRMDLRETGRGEVDSVGLR
jgi:hypothetical protein